MIDLSQDKVYFISEIGINHNGSVDLCTELIEKSIESYADIIKLTDLDELYPTNKINSFGLGSQYIIP